VTLLRCSFLQCAIDFTRRQRAAAEWQRLLQIVFGRLGRLGQARVARRAGQLHHRLLGRLHLLDVAFHFLFPSTGIDPQLPGPVGERGGSLLHVANDGLRASDRRFAFNLLFHVSEEAVLPNGQADDEGYKSDECENVLGHERISLGNCLQQRFSTTVCNNGKDN
jgi:hypothetical protein